MRRKPGILPTLRRQSTESLQSAQFGVTIFLVGGWPLSGAGRPSDEGASSGRGIRVGVRGCGGSGGVFRATGRCRRRDSRGPFVGTNRPSGESDRPNRGTPRRFQVITNEGGDHPYRASPSLFRHAHQQPGSPGPSFAQGIRGLSCTRRFRGFSMCFAVTGRRAFSAPLAAGPPRPPAGSRSSASSSSSGSRSRSIFTRRWRRRRAPRRGTRRRRRRPARTWPPAGSARARPRARRARR